MKSREILEIIRKGDIDPKIGKVLFIQNERIDTMEKNAVVLAQVIEKMQQFFSDQLRLQAGMNKWIDQVGQTLGLDKKATSQVNSEAIEQRPHLSGFE